jgi:hypothetical protein
VLSGTRKLSNLPLQTDRYKRRLSVALSSWFEL